MQQLFVSYAREDRPRAEPMVGMLRAAGFDVFWDQSLPAGVDWAEFLDAKLDSAHCLLVLWTPSSVASRWVRTEANEALQKDKLLPVLLDDVRPPLAFRQIQCFDLTGWQGDPADPRLPRLADELRARVGAAQPSPPPSPTTPAKPPPPIPEPPPPPPPAGLAWLGWAIAAVVLSIVIGATWSLLQGGGQDAAAPVAPVAAPGASAASVPASAPSPIRAASKAAAPAAVDSVRCNAINEQISLNLPVSAADRAFLQRGCRN